LAKVEKRKAGALFDRLMGGAVLEAPSLFVAEDAKRVAVHELGDGLAGNGGAIIGVTLIPCLRLLERDIMIS